MHWGDGSVPKSEAGTLETVLQQENHHLCNTPEPDEAGGTQAFNKSHSISANTQGPLCYLLQHCLKPTSNKGHPNGYSFPGSFVEVKKISK